MVYRRCKAGGAALVAVAAVLALPSGSGCAGRQTIRMQVLESAPPAETIETHRVVLGELSSLADLYRPLCPRLGVIQVTRAKDWQRLARAAPGLGSCPDFSQGAVVGIVSRAGTPLDGIWPIEITQTRSAQGAGYVCAEFRPGTYLADGVACVTLVQYRGLDRVLMADVNGLRYFTD